jgi:nucleoside-diphosphate-sugar epimerase
MGGACLVTGATGLLGSHIAEQLRSTGRTVRALVRPGSDTAFLRSIGVELVTGDLTSRDDCQRALEGVETVFHSAAKVGDWGKWAEFQRSCVEATEALARQASRVGVERFVHISSTSAYGHPRDPGRPIDETFPLGQDFWWFWDYYTRSKVESERVLWRQAESEGLRLTVIRPSWLYGERDRTTVARLVGRLRGPGVPLIGRGDNPLSAVYAGSVAEGAILASSHPGALGEAFNITDQGPLTQREFLEHFARACGGRLTGQRLPYGLVYSFAFLAEGVGRLTGRSRPPMITRYATWLMGRSLSYSTAKAREVLGWRPRLTYAESIGRSVDWYLRQVGDST